MIMQFIVSNLYPHERTSLTILLSIHTRRIFDCAKDEYPKYWSIAMKSGNLMEM
jgi:hypothetical protein